MIQPPEQRPDPWAAALAYATEHAWNGAQSRYVFSGMTCKRAGSANRQAQFACRSRIRDRRSGRVSELRFLLVPDGTRIG